MLQIDFQMLWEVSTRKNWFNGNIEDPQSKRTEFKSL